MRPHAIRAARSSTLVALLAGTAALLLVATRHASTTPVGGAAAHALFAGFGFALLASMPGMSTLPRVVRSILPRGR